MFAYLCLPEAILQLALITTAVGMRHKSSRRGMKNWDRTHDATTLVTALGILQDAAPVKM
jgi:hypothetical protein